MKTFEELKSELNAKWTGFTIKAKVKTREAFEWTKENKEIVISVVVPAAIVAIKTVTGVAKSVDRKIDLKKEQDLKELYIYDRSLGCYHELKHKLSSNEALEIDRRRNTGESMIHILNTMKLLK